MFFFFEVKMEENNLVVFKEFLEKPNDSRDMKENVYSQNFGKVMKR